MPGKYLAELSPAMFLCRQTLATKVPQRLYKYLLTKEFLGGYYLPTVAVFIRRAAAAPVTYINQRHKFFYMFIYFTKQKKITS